jgi:hypothetical protein
MLQTAALNRNVVVRPTGLVSLIRSDAAFMTVRLSRSSVLRCRIKRISGSRCHFRLISEHR